MNLFRKTRPAEEHEDRKSDFMKQTPYWSTRPVQYTVMRSFIELKDELDRYLDRLFKGDIDEGNADVLDNIIADHTNAALNDLAIQKSDHTDFIEAYWGNSQAMMESFEKHKATVEKHLEMIAPRIEELERRLYENTFEKEGECYE